MKHQQLRLHMVLGALAALLAACGGGGGGEDGVGDASATAAAPAAPPAVPPAAPGPVPAAWTALSASAPEDLVGVWESGCRSLVGGGSVIQEYTIVRTGPQTVTIQEKATHFVSSDCRSFVNGATTYTTPPTYTLTGMRTFENGTRSFAAIVSIQPTAPFRQIVVLRADGTLHFGSVLGTKDTEGYPVGVLPPEYAARRK